MLGLLIARHHDQEIAIHAFHHGGRGHCRHRRTAIVEGQTRHRHCDPPPLLREPVVTRFEANFRHRQIEPGNRLNGARLDLSGCLRQGQTHAELLCTCLLRSGKTLPQKLFDHNRFRSGDFGRKRRLGCEPGWQPGFNGAERAPFQIHVMRGIELEDEIEARIAGILRHKSQPLGAALRARPLQARGAAWTGAEHLPFLAAVAQPPGGEQFAQNPQRYRTAGQLNVRAMEACLPDPKQIVSNETIGFREEARALQFWAQRDLQIVVFDVREAAVLFHPHA